MENVGNNKNFDVSYGVSSVAITSTGAVASKKSASFQGVQCLAGTSTVSIRIYDNSSTATGKLLGIYSTTAGAMIIDNKFNPVVAKYGIFVVGTGTNHEGVVFFSPKG